MFTNSEHTGVKRHSQMLYELLKLLKEFRDVTSVNVMRFSIDSATSFYTSFSESFADALNGWTLMMTVWYFNFRKVEHIVILTFAKKNVTPTTRHIRDLLFCNHSQLIISVFWPVRVSFNLNWESLFTIKYFLNRYITFMC